MELTIAQETQGDWTVLLVDGELDLYSQPMLRDRIHEVATDGGRVALDLRGVSFIDSSGLGAIVGGVKHLRERGGQLAVVANGNGPLARMLALTGLDQVIHPLADPASLPGIT
jgi:anti-sigma B factor antagonist